jgi:hypothetical protein
LIWLGARRRPPESARHTEILAVLAARPAGIISEQLAALDFHDPRRSLAAAELQALRSAD